MFCDNETNTARLFGAAPVTAYPKDGINDHVVSGADTVNPQHRGTKAAWWYQVTVPGGGRVELRLRLHRPVPDQTAPPAGWSDSYFDDVMADREREADEFYAAIAPAGIGAGADAGDAPVLRGAGLEQADVPVPGQPVVGRRPRPAGAAGRAP